MSRALGFTIFTFTLLVAANWLFSFFFPTIGSIPMIARSDSELASISVNLFAKNGIGRSFITQGYGRTPYSYLYLNDWHNGIDIAAAYGAPLYSLSDGVVIATGNQDDYCYHRGFGKYVAVKDATHNLIVWYAHLGTIAVAPGEAVKKDSELGTIGATGLETGTHLHLSIFDARGFSMTVRNGCGPDPTGNDRNPLNYLGSVYN